MVKCCFRCKLQKPVDAFYRNALSKDGYTYLCKTCWDSRATTRRRARGIKPAVVATTTTQRRCIKCKTWKVFTEFERDNSDPRGIQHVCRICSHLARIRKARACGVHPVPVIRDGNEKRCSQCKKWYNLITGFYKASREPDGRAGVCRSCIREINRRPDARLANRLRTRMRSALKNGAKAFHTFELIGCTIEQLKQQFELQFKPGMSWKNHSRNGWHIGHIRDCCSFDLTDPEQQRQCFHYTNLEPQWAGDNLSKPRDKKGNNYGHQSSNQRR